MVKSNILEDGVYEATVSYKNSLSSYYTNYTLNVVVIDDTVLQINFENGGYINYKSLNIQSYSGGALSFSKDVFGNISSIKTTVIVRELSGNTFIYKISLN